MPKSHLTPSRPVRWFVALAVGVLSLAVLAGCGSDSDDSSSTDTGGGAALTEIADGTYESTEVTGHDLVEDSKLIFTFEGDQLSVQAGCNNLGSAYALADGVLKWDGKPRATMMACDDALMEQDTWITDLLTEGMDATGSDTAITLTSGDVTIELEAA